MKSRLIEGLVALVAVAMVARVVYGLFSPLIVPLITVLALVGVATLALRHWRSH